MTSQVYNVPQLAVKVGGYWNISGNIISGLTDIRFLATFWYLRKFEESQTTGIRLKELVQM